ncbi:hypothetical protein EG68_03011 [Paragonimus skrjabini miyazakii]|uniref:BHLH domain-containing protein n=1 Tax=Paragonimus skrjabini miyazakii TaxID=59628 RepID=A0A8S9Z2R4_9TREM|nr:hypothetical protein EG68_03011 [Paragonimus skrjabini miyazakii]
MLTNMGEIEEELDEDVVADHLRGSDLNNYDHGYLQFANFDKTSDANWASILSRQKTTLDETSPQTASHLSPEPASISDLASPLTGSESVTNMVGEQPSSTDIDCGIPVGTNFLPPVSTFEYGQRLPSLESSSSAPIGRSVGGLTSQSLFAWQPFGTTSSSSMHSQSQSSSLHGPGGPLFPLVPGSVGAYGTEFLTHSPSSTNSVSIPCGSLDTHDKLDTSQFNPLTYANVSAAAAIAASGRLRGNIASPSGHDLQPIRMDIGLSVAHPSAAVTPVPTYAPSAGSSNSQSSTPAHQGFSFTSNGAPGSQQINPNVSLSGQSYDDGCKSVTFKQRSKKESHNRIERKRRDYINSQIVYLSSLLPPELYRDVDGRRNKGSVLRLSVNYIKDLREAISRMAGLKQENSLARQLIPLLLKRVETLERMIQEQGGNPGTSSPSTVSPRNSASFEALYQSWLSVNEANQRAANNGTAGNLTPGSRITGQSVVTSVPVSESHYFQEMIQTDADGTDLESGIVVRCGSTSSPASIKARLVNVKREQMEEDRLAESAPSRVRLDACRIPLGCAHRPNFTDLPSVPSRIDEEATPLNHSVAFGIQPGLSYERYHRLMQPACQPGVFGQNE